MDTALKLILIGSLVTTAGDIVMKEWTVTDKRTLYLAGMLVYLVGLNFLARSYRYENIAVASLVFVILNIVVLALVSYLLFGEGLSPLRLVGMGVGLLAIVILELA